jgi:hypothetical protein
VLQALIPGAAGQPHVTLGGAGHFSQEDAAPELARVVVDLARRLGEQPSAARAADAAGAAVKAAPDSQR